jgi:hypothetical protein
MAFVRTGWSDPRLHEQALDAAHFDELVVIGRRHTDELVRLVARYEQERALSIARHELARECLWRAGSVSDATAEHSEKPGQVRRREPS